MIPQVSIASPEEMKLKYPLEIEGRICYFVTRKKMSPKSNKIPNEIMAKSKEPIRLRKRKLASGNISLNLDIYIDGKRS